MEVTQILTRTIGAAIRLAKQGYHVRDAVFGFRNVRTVTPEGKSASIMEPLEPEATWIRSIFRLRAEGGWSDKTICDHVNAMGFQSRKVHRRDKTTGQISAIHGEKPLTPKQLQRYVEKPIYAGVKVERWTNFEPIKAKFDGLVSIEQFNRANYGSIGIIENADGGYAISKGEPREKIAWRDKPEFLLRHVILCPECKNPLWASKSTGKSGKRFGYFHCNKSHKRISYPQREFEETVGKYLEKVQYKSGFLGIFKEAVREVWIENNKTKKADADLVDRHIETLQQKQKNLIDRIGTTTSPIVQNKLEQEIEDLEQAIKDAENNRPNDRLTEQQIEEFFALARERLEHPAKTPQDSSTQSQIIGEWSTIFAETPSFEEIKSGTPRLTLMYRLGSEPYLDKRQVVRHLSLHWNTFVKEVLLWL